MSKRKGFNSDERAREVSLIPESAMTPGERMRREKDRVISSPDLDVDLVAHRVHALMMANAPATAPQQATTPRLGVTPGLTPYDTALLLYGLREDTPDGTLNPMIEQFHDATWFTQGDGDDSWCASFVNWVLQQHGIEGTSSPRARSFLDWGKGGIGAEHSFQQGDIAVFSRGPNPAKGHVGFIHRVNVDTITVLGGNQNNMVCFKEYATSRLLSIRTVTGLT